MISNVTCDAHKKTLVHDPTKLACSSLRSNKDYLYSCRVSWTVQHVVVSALCPVLFKC